MQDRNTAVHGLKVESEGRKAWFYSYLLFLFFSALPDSRAFAEDLRLQDLIDEALKNNFGVLASQARVDTAAYRIPQAKSLPDPTITFGYQNEGWTRYSYGDTQGAEWLFSASQTFLYPGKLDLKGKSAISDSEIIKASLGDTKLKTIANVKGLYYDLFLAYKTIDIIWDKTALFSKIEDAAHARYSAGMAQAQEVVMAQTEKYILLEREEIQKQKIRSVEAMLNANLGRDIKIPLGRPVEPASTPFDHSLDGIVGIARERSPELKGRTKLIESSEVKVEIAKKEYYPNFTVGANIYKRSGNFEDMWSLTTAVNLPLYYKTKQQQGVSEAVSVLSEARNEFMASEAAISAAIGSNYATVKTSEKLMDLYKKALIPKTYQDFELSLAGYITGKTEAITVITRLKALNDYDLLYWEQFVEKEKAIARIEALTGMEVAVK